MIRQQKLDSELPLKPARKKAEPEKPGSKKTIIVLFLVTLGLSILFYLRTEIPKLLKDLTIPDKIIIEKGGE